MCPVVSAVRRSCLCYVMRSSVAGLWNVCLETAEVQRSSPCTPFSRASEQSGRTVLDPDAPLAVVHVRADLQGAHAVEGRADLRADAGGRGGARARNDSRLNASVILSWSGHALRRPELISKWERCEN